MRLRGLPAGLEGYVAMAVPDILAVRVYVVPGPSGTGTGTVFFGRLPGGLWCHLARVPGPGTAWGPAPDGPEPSSLAKVGLWATGYLASQTSPSLPPDLGPLLALLSAPGLREVLSVMES